MLAIVPGATHRQVMPSALDAVAQFVRDQLSS
jgi:hypothetical protein